MTIEERKRKLIDWISNIQNESLINRMEELKMGSVNEIPNEILALLDTSNATRKADLVEHTTSRNLLNPQ